MNLHEASTADRGHSVLGWSILVVLTAAVGTAIGWLAAEILTAVAT